jgi:hypothetical protein
MAMFCNRCGAQLQADFNLCPKCGNPVSAGGPGSTFPTRLEKHLRILGILWIVVGVLGIIPSLAVMAISHHPHFLLGDEVFSRPFMPPLMFSMGSIFFLVAAGGILVGWGLMNREGWARIAAIVVAFLAVFHPPFGTAMGIYTLWVLLPNHARAEYERLSTR